MYAETTTNEKGVKRFNLVDLSIPQLTILRHALANYHAQTCEIFITPGHTLEAEPAELNYRLYQTEQLARKIKHLITQQIIEK